MSSDKQQILEVWEELFGTAVESAHSRIAALFQACNQFDATLKVNVGAAGDFGERITWAKEQQLLAEARDAYFAAGLRNNVAHDAILPTLAEVLRAISGLAGSDLEVQGLWADTDEEWIESQCATAMALGKRLATGGGQFILGRDAILLKDLAILSAADSVTSVIVSAALLDLVLRDRLEEVEPEENTTTRQDSLGARVARAFRLGWLHGDNVRLDLEDAIDVRNHVAHELKSSAFVDPSHCSAFVSAAMGLAPAVRVVQDPPRTEVQPRQRVPAEVLQPQIQESPLTATEVVVCCIVGLVVALVIIIASSSKTERDINTSWTKKLTGGPISILSRPLPESVAVVAWDSDATKPWFSVHELPSEAKWSKWAELVCGAGGNVFDVLMSIGDSAEGIHAPYLDDPHGFALPRARIELSCGRRFEDVQAPHVYGTASLLLMRDEAPAGWLQAISSSNNPPNIVRGLDFEEKDYSGNSGVCFRVAVGGSRGLEAPRCVPVFSKAISMDSGILVGGTHIHVSQFLADGERKQVTGKAWAHRLSNLAPHVADLARWEVAAMESRDPCGELFAYFGSQVGFAIEETVRQVTKSGIWGNPVRINGAGWARGIGRLDTSRGFVVRMIIGTANEREAANLAQKILRERDACAARLEGVSASLGTLFKKRNAFLIHRLSSYALVQAYQRAVALSQARVVDRNTVWELAVQFDKASGDVLTLYSDVQQLRAKTVARMIDTVVLEGSRPSVDDLESLAGTRK